jgi:hypothetical protein
MSVSFPPQTFVREPLPYTPRVTVKIFKIVLSSNFVQAPHPKSVQHLMYGDKRQGVLCQMCNGERTYSLTSLPQCTYILTVLYLSVKKCMHFVRRIQRCCLYSYCMDAVTKEVNRRPLTAETLVQSQVGQHGIRGEQIGNYSSST